MMRPITRFSPNEVLIAAAVLAALAAPVHAQRQFEELGRRLPVDGATTRSVALGDVDGDGDLDLVLGNSGPAGSGGRNRLYLNDGTGTFSDATVSRMPVDSDLTLSVALGDVDGDGDLDLVLGNSGPAGSGGRNRLYLNDGAGTFVDATASRMPAFIEFTTSVALGDVDGDGDLDIVLGNTPCPFSGVPSAQDRLYLNDGTGTFVDATAGRMPVDNEETRGMALGDVDGDGDLDLVLGDELEAFAFFPSLQTRMYLNDGTGRFANTGGMPADSDSTSSVALGDVDGDGDLDLVLGNRPDGFNLGQNRLYLNDGTGTFSDATASRMPVDSDRTVSLALGDVDSDGDLDIVLGNRPDGPNPGQNRLYLNDGTGTFSDATASRMPVDNDRTASLALGEVDGDGDLDLVLGNGYFSGQQNRLYLNLLRQLDTPAPPRVGQPYQLDLYSRFGPSNALGIAVLSPAAATIPSPFGTLGVDLTNAVTLPFTPIPQPAGLASASFTIPNFPVFLGTDVFGQALIVDVNNLFGRLTNVTSDVIQ